MIKSLYVHIPFCEKKCLYCDFNSNTKIYMQDQYLKALEKELLNIDQNKFKTIFVGGGTPTILSAENLEKLMRNLERFCAEEFTVECNPGTLTKEKLYIMRKHGVNRLSIGLQAWQDSHLISLGRIHSQKDFIDNFKLARDLGFNNINVDLMFAIPNQSFHDWDETISRILEFSPEHLSCYGLIIEEGTPFHDMYSKGNLTLLDEELERQMYYHTVEKLRKNNYLHYEISNFTKEGYECKHNVTYWRNEEYYGVGAGAHSFVNNVRFSNIVDVGMYIDRIENSNRGWIENQITISKEEEISEYMFLGLRMMRGIDKREFKNRFTIDIEKIYSKEIIDLKKIGLIEEIGTNIVLTKLGIDLSNQVFIKFIK